MERPEPDIEYCNRLSLLELLKHHRATVYYLNDYLIGKDNDYLIGKDTVMLKII